jgi:hypothetical protein
MDSDFPPPPPPSNSERFFFEILALEPQPSFDKGAESLWHAAQKQVPHYVNDKLKEGEALPPWLPTNMCAVHLRRL